MMRRFKIIPRYLRLMKMVTSDALCEYNKTQKASDKKVYYILNDAQYDIECSYKKHKKIGDPLEVLNKILEDLLKDCEKWRLLYRTMGAKKILEKYNSNRKAFRMLVKVHEEMLAEVEECGFK